MTPRAEFVKAVKGFEAACPCRATLSIQHWIPCRRNQGALCSCSAHVYFGAGTIPPDTGVCLWPGHAHAREAVRAFADAVCEAIDDRHGGAKDYHENRLLHETCIRDLLAECGMGEDDDIPTRV